MKLWKKCAGISINSFNKSSCLQGLLIQEMFSISGVKGNTVALWNGDENLNFERFTFVRVSQMTSIAVCDNFVICDSWAQWLLLMVLKS